MPENHTPVPLPPTPEAMLAELAANFIEAAVAAEEAPAEEALEAFQLAPLQVLDREGIDPESDEGDDLLETVSASLEKTWEGNALLDDPLMAYTFCYVVTLALIHEKDQDWLQETLDAIVSRAEELNDMVYE